MEAATDELYDNVKKYSMLSNKSQKMIDALISATYQMEKSEGELKGESFDITIVPKKK